MADSKNVSPRTPQVNVLSGTDTDKMLDGDPHYSIAVSVTSAGGKPSTLMIPDMLGVKDGSSPVYLTKPISLKGDKLKTFLQNKGVELPTPVDNLLAATTITCDAFYVTAEKSVAKTASEEEKTKAKTEAKSGPVLVMFSIGFADLIGQMTGDDSIKDLFTIEGASLRVFRCPKEDYGMLQKYAKELLYEDILTDVVADAPTSPAPAPANPSA